MLKRLALTGLAATLALGMGTACKKKDKDKKKDKAPPAKKDKTPPKETKKMPVPTPPEMVAKIESKSGSKVTGTVTFKQDSAGSPVKIEAKLSGLDKGDHGFHIHEKGDCSAPDAKSAGGHFNPGKTEHADRSAAKQHAGDLGNITADDKGNAVLTVEWKHITLEAGKPNSVGGLAVVVHAKKDDGKSQPSGAAGARVGCGVIKPVAGDSGAKMDDATKNADEAAKKAADGDKAAGAKKDDKAGKSAK
jgi:Cu-Zn family superoxide dismutase